MFLATLCCGTGPATLPSWLSLPSCIWSLQFKETCLTGGCPEHPQGLLSEITNSPCSAELGEKKKKRKSGNIFPVFWIGRVCQIIFTPCSKICYKALCRNQEKLWGDWVAWSANINHRTKKSEAESGLQALFSGGPAHPQHPAVPALWLISVVQGDKAEQDTDTQGLSWCLLCPSATSASFIWDKVVCRHLTQWCSSSSTIWWRASMQY